MRDGDDGFALHHPIQRFLNGGFNFTVERARGLIKDKDGCVFQDHPRQRDALPLATG